MLQGACGTHDRLRSMIYIISIATINHKDKIKGERGLAWYNVPSLCWVKLKAAVSTLRSWRTVRAHPPLILYLEAPIMATMCPKVLVLQIQAPHCTLGVGNSRRPIPCLQHGVVGVGPCDSVILRPSPLSRRVPECNGDHSR